jgi:hypothetical protein
MKKYQDSSEEILDTHECCVCRRPLKECSKYINLVQLPFTVPWPFPVMGHALTGVKRRGVAVVCDQCFDKPNGKKLDIKFVLEYKGGGILYHDVNEIK